MATLDITSRDSNLYLKYMYHYFVQLSFCFIQSHSFSLVLLRLFTLYLYIENDTIFVCSYTCIHTCIYLQYSIPHTVLYCIKNISETMCCCSIHHQYTPSRLSSSQSHGRPSKIQRRETIHNS